MKIYLILFFCILFYSSVYSQSYWGVNFDGGGLYDNQIVLDTSVNNHSQWQIGRPSKTNFNSAYSIPNALVTDTLNALIPNDTSVFYLKHGRPPLIYHYFEMTFEFMMDIGSGDKAIIEVSPDTGHTWINMITEDSTYDFSWNPRPVLVGSTNGLWQFAYVNMDGWANSLGNYPVNITADTLIFRFTYITDSSTSQRDGWMIDNFQINDEFEGIKKYENDNLISISPNPVNNLLHFHRLLTHQGASYKIFDYEGKLILCDKDIKDENIDVQQLPDGIYLLKYVDQNICSVKRFVVNHLR